MKMDSQSFYAGMHKMARMWGKKLSDDQIELYFAKLSALSEKPWIEIVDHAMDKCRSFPSRGELWALWLEWQEANPDKMRSDRREVQCDICDNRGYLDVEYIPKHLRDRVQLKNPKIDLETLWNDQRAIYAGVVNCKHCGNPCFATAVVPSRYKHEIEQDPWMRLALRNAPEVSREFKTLNDMAEAATQSNTQGVPF